MRRIALINGIIAGLIASGMLLIYYPLMRNGTLNTSNSMWVGYVSMVIAFTMIFFGVRTYRDKYLNGSISFGKAFKVGILITAVASIIYATTWQIYSYTVATDFTEFYAQCQINILKAEGASMKEISEAQTDIAKWNKLYEIPVVRFLMSVMEILPVGIIISLLAAAILRKREKLPA